MPFKKKKTFCRKNARPPFAARTVRRVDGAYLVDYGPMYFGNFVYGVYIRNWRVQVVWFKRFLIRDVPLQDSAGIKIDGDGKYLKLRSGGRVGLRWITMREFEELGKGMAYCIGVEGNLPGDSSAQIRAAAI